MKLIQLNNNNHPLADFCRILNFVINSLLHSSRDFILDEILGSEAFNLAQRWKIDKINLKKRSFCNFKFQQDY